MQHNPFEQYTCNRWIFYELRAIGLVSQFYDYHLQKSNQILGITYAQIIDLNKMCTDVIQTSISDNDIATSPPP